MGESHIPITPLAVKNCASKFAYVSEARARLFGQRALKGKKEKELYVYRCNICGGIHLTKIATGPDIIGGPITATSLGIK